MRAGRETAWIGLGNLNFYTYDIHGSAARLGEAGYRFWSEPTTYEMSEAVGSPTEVVFEAPDSVPVNLVQLIRGAATQTGEMAAFLDSHGMTTAGYTQVTTSAHYVRDMDTAIEFHRRVLGMEPLIDEVLDRPEQNNFLGLAEDARTRVGVREGAATCSERWRCAARSTTTAWTSPDGPKLRTSAIWLWGFEVPDLDRAVDRAGELGVEAPAAPQMIDPASSGAPPGCGGPGGGVRAPGITYTRRSRRHERLDRQDSPGHRGRAGGLAGRWPSCSDGPGRP